MITFKFRTFEVPIYRYPAYFLIFLLSCSNSDEGGPDRHVSDPVNVTIDLNTTYQTISGFGGANQMWGTEFIKPSDADLAFNTGDDALGLSIFRVRIASDPNEWPLILESVKEAQKHGVKILASPWSPPPALKSNGSEVGGYLPEENFGAFADHINEFVQFMETNGVEIYAISIQNEPDIEVTYESCDWTAPAIRDFIKNYGAEIENTKVAAPESFNFNSAFTNVILSDEAAMDNLDIVAGHIYGGGLGPFPLAEQNDKEIWMTEYLLNLNATSDWDVQSEEVKWDESLAMLHTIHEAMASNWNAYIWWYLKRYYSFIGDGDQGTVEGQILKRGYAFSQFSSFVRPGFVRVKTAIENDKGLDITSFQDGNKVIVVFTNTTDQSVKDLHLSLGGQSPVSAVSYSTGSTLNRQRKQLEIVDELVVLHMPAKTVTTVVISK